MTSFYTSLNGLKNSQTDLSTIAHNIANAETTGYKKSSVEFADIVANGSAANPRLSQGLGATVAGVNQNFGLGAIEQTGRSLDVAIDGDGFFAIRNPESGQVLFTRNGNFQIDGAGALTDFSGKTLQVFEVDATGTVINPGVTIDGMVPTVNGGGAELSSIVIEKNGLINAAYADGTTEPVGRVALATFIAPTGLKAVGSTNWETTGFSGTATFELPGNGRNGQLLSGALEKSNVDLAEEMVGLITAQRNFQANAKAIDTATQFSQTIINLRS
ncbi:flagellar hook-basal body protein [Alteraurantiacibacter aquimixticola]|uniref:Flagellar hook protein FlgE n=1 Tax=Alteraurantiacibacter aquimixticola TaxID=2489173 RepID=A0A4T3F557_9SPHN|nr:flagellar hook basal-body protein [Alteraurantiacibacter aquimixticola]TIX51514.1 flagellar hook basal-body protein [Alteraurantiacibacter aquimixticola]